MVGLRRLAPFAAVFSLFGADAEAQEGVGMRLEAAGFVMRAANTADRMARLHTLPARKFVVRRKNGAPYYLYADPGYCRCVFVGTQQAMNSYRDMVAPPPTAPGYRDFANSPSASGASIENEMIHDMDQDGDPPGEGDILHPGF